MKTQKLGQVVAGVSVSPKTGKVKCFGILSFNVDGNFLGAESVAPFIGTLEDQEDTRRLKDIVVDLLNREPSFGLKYEVDYDKIFLLDKKTFESFAMKHDQLHADDVQRNRQARHPLTIYFSPFRSASTGKVRSKHFLVIDVDGKVVEDWADPRGWTIGFTDKRLTNPRSLKMAREFIASHGLRLEKGDRVIRLNPQGMRNKLNQFAVKDPADKPRL